MYETIVPWWTAVATGTAPEDAGAITQADREFAEMLTRMTKVVASRTLKAREERHVIADDVPRQLEELKRRPGASMMLSCGPALLSELAQKPALIDEYDTSRASRRLSGHRRRLASGSLSEDAVMLCVAYGRRELPSCDAGGSQCGSCGR
jgi:hypothetical protein